MKLMKASADLGFATAEELAKVIEHAALKANGTKDDVRRLCSEAKQYGFWAVCVSPFLVPIAKAELKGTKVKISAVVGFPLGFTYAEVKLGEASRAIALGAEEIDMVMNIQAFKSGDRQIVFDETNALANYCRQENRLLKVIIECCYLSNSEKVEAAVTAENAGANFVKTSTGFGTSGAKVEDVALLRRVLKPSTGIKAAGGIATLADALAMVRAGANRIGTSSGAKIMQEWYQLHEER